MNLKRQWRYCFRASKQQRAARFGGKYELYSYADKVLAGELGQCEDGEYTGKYVRTEYYVGAEPIHDQKGVLTSRIRDFDNDGEEELMVLVMTNDERVTSYAETDQNAVYLRMYESENGEDCPSG